ncbi:MAG TPA: hypothetical protein GX706_00855 [Candidatus Moranbacteria bacterium]|nr:hypothetical protein [Candidatus Moranbacteria bacterium]
MKLTDILRKIFYREEPKVTKRKVSRDYYDPRREKEGRFAKISGDIYQEQEVGAMPEEVQREKNRETIIKGAIIFGVVLTLAVSFLIYLRVTSNTYNDDKVRINIIGQERVESPTRAKYEIEVKNDNLVELENAAVFVEGPFLGKFVQSEEVEVQNERWVKKNLGTIGKKSSKKFSIEIDFLASKQDQVYINVQLEYQPKNFSSQFSASASKDILVIPSSLTLKLVPTSQAASGEKIAVDVFVKNESESPRENIFVELNYPEDFSFLKGEPEPTTGNNRWLISKINPQEEQKIKIEGTLEGLYETVKQIRGVLKEEYQGGERVIFDTEAVIRMVTDRLALQQVVSQENVYAGQSLTYDVFFRNSSPIALRDLILTQHISSAIINKESVYPANGGFYNSRENTITWKASDVPELKVLEPNQQAKVSFTVSLQENLPAKNKDDKNFKIVSQAEIHSLDVDSPIGHNKKIFSSNKEVLVNSKLILEREIVQKDELISTEGPIPLEVDKETTFLVKLRVLNTSNDLKNVTLKTSLPSGVAWKSQVEPTNSGIEFNERTNELSWFIGTVDAHTGFLKPAIPLAFKIGITPSQNQIREAPDLLNNLVIFADDTFTKKKIQYEFGGANTGSVRDIRESRVMPASQSEQEQSTQTNEDASSTNLQESSTTTPTQ